MVDLAFVDTETLGLHPDAPIWEFAAIRRSPNGMGWTEDALHFFIHHDPQPWEHTLAEQFAADYHARYDESEAFRPSAAARAIAVFLHGTNLVICNPAFDDPRLAALLRRNDFEPSWHYHPDDISSLAKGYLAARGELPAQPWKSEQLSTALGVDPARYERHTAMGDARWVRDQWDIVMGGAR